MTSLNTPINVNVCSGDGTIFSTPVNGTGSSTGQKLTFTNLGQIGARVYAQTISDNVQFRRLLEGANMTIVEGINGITLGVADLGFDASQPVVRAIPGLQGVTLGTQGVLATLRAILYPTQPPTISMLANKLGFELGDTSDIVISWTVIKTDEQILTISINNTPIIPTGNSQQGTFNIPKTGLVDVPVNMVVSTATKVVNASLTVVGFHKIRIGATTKNGTSALILDSDINNIGGFASTTYTVPPRMVNVPVSYYLLISISNLLLGGNTPVFKINGFVNNAFNLVRNNAFVNTLGYSEPTSVWVSQQFSTGNLQIEIA